MPSRAGEIVAVIDTMAPVAADRARRPSAVCSCGRLSPNTWKNPTIGIKARGQNPGAARSISSEAELTQIWRACGDDDFGHHQILLILTGQRKTEIGLAALVEIDLDERQIKLPRRAARTAER